MFIQIKPRTEPSVEEMIGAITLRMSQRRLSELAKGDNFWRWVGISALEREVQPGVEEHRTKLLYYWENSSKLTLILGPHGHGKDALADVLYPSGGDIRGVPTSRLLIEFIVGREILKQSPDDPWYGLGVEEIYNRRHERSQWLNQIGRALRVSAPGFLLKELIRRGSRTAVGIRDGSELLAAFDVADQVIWVHNPLKSPYDPTLEYGLESLIHVTRLWSTSLVLYRNDGSLADMQPEVREAIRAGIVSSSDPVYASIQPTNSPDNAT